MKPAKYPCGSALGIVGFKKFFYLSDLVALYVPLKNLPIVGW